MVLLLSRFVDASLIERQSSWLDKAYGFLEIMISSGNRIAEFRMTELRKLDEMLTDYVQNQNQSSMPTTMHEGGFHIQRSNIELNFPEGYHSTASLISQNDSMPPPFTGLSDEGSGFGDDLTAEQILAVAESMDLESTDWLSFATLENCQTVDPRL